MEYDSGMRSGVLSCLVAIGVVACGASSARSVTSAPVGEPYPIRLHRAAAIGQRAHVTSERSHREQTVTTFRGQVVDTADATSVFRFDAFVEVLQVDARGEPSELRYDVRSFTREQGGLATDLVRAGQVISVSTAETREGARVHVDAAPVSEELMNALDEVIVLVRGASDDDARLGSATPRAVGERWVGDVVDVARGLTRQSPIRLDPSHVHGDVGVVERTVVEGIDGLTIGVSIDADHVGVEGLAEGASLREGRVTMSVTGFFPLDEAIPRLRESVETHADLALAMSTPQGAAEVALTMTIASHRTFEPL